MFNIFEKKSESNIAEELKTRVELARNRHEKFHLVKGHPGPSEVTEEEMELLCDPEPDLTGGLCQLILAEISTSREIDRGGLVDAVLDGNTSDDVAGGMDNRARVQQAVDKMIEWGFLLDENDIIKNNVMSD